LAHPVLFLCCVGRLFVVISNQGVAGASRRVAPLSTPAARCFISQTPTQYAAAAAAFHPASQPATWWYAVLVVGHVTSYEFVRSSVALWWKLSCRQVIVLQLLTASISSSPSLLR